MSVRAKCQFERSREQNRKNMQKIRCIIIDDEPLAITALKNLLKKLDYIEIVNTYNDSIEAFQQLQFNSVDLIFLDIEMPEISGIQLYKSLNNPPQVIFTTAYRDYAIDAFDLNATDYLLKPVSFERLLKALNKVTISVRNNIPDKKTNSPDEYIYFKADGKQEKIRFDDILYIECLKDYVHVITKDKKVITRLTMKKAEELLPPNLFIRIHRSYIVSTDKITGYSPTFVYLQDTTLPISRSYRVEVMKVLV